MMKKTRKDTKNISTRLINGDVMMSCPACGELLTRMDVESYERCPFCNHKFETTDKSVEDLLYYPVIDNWYKMNIGQIQQLGQETDGGRSSWL